MRFWIKIFLIFVLVTNSAPTVFSVSPAQRAIKIKPVEKQYFTFYFSEPQYIDGADSILNQTRRKMITLLRDSLSYKPSIYLLDDLDDFNRLVAGKFPDWGAAAAYPERELIAIKSPLTFNINKSLRELLAHEYTHLAVSHKCGFYEPPRWLNEGLAMDASMEWSWSDNLAMGKAAVFGQFIPLQKIEMVNRFNESKAHVAYAESYLAVQFMLKRYGQNSINLFLTQISQKKTAGDAMYAATGLSMMEFQQDFEKYLSQRFNYASLFMDTIFFWALLAIIVVAAFFMRFRKRRKFYRKWEDEEKYQSTDFDYGDPDNPEQVDDDDEPWRH